MAISTAELSLEQAPPFSVPLRFFLTAPLFGIAAGALLLYYGPGLLVTRWSPLTFGLIHLFTLGVLSMVMCGAILQVLPVLGGVPVPAAPAVGAVVHLMLTLGTLALTGGFLWGWPPAFDIALIMLGGGFGLFIGAVGLALWRAEIANPTVRGLQASVFSLLLTLFLGTFLVGMLTGYGSSPHLQQFVNLHLGWGFLGWVGLLVMGVAFQVVPLFQMTPEFPALIRRFLVLAMLLTLLLWTLSKILPGWEPVALGTELLLAAGFAGFGGLILQLLRQRRRKVGDVSLVFWRLFSLALLLTAALRVAGLLLPALAAWPGYSLMMGMGLLVAVSLSAISGMLHKIVPFLAWFHLQHRQMALMQHGRVQIPHMKELHPDAWGWWHFRLHLALIVLSVFALIFPDQLARPLGVLVVAAFGVLWLGLLKAARRYRTATIAMDQLEASSAADSSAV